MRKYKIIIIFFLISISKSAFADMDSLQQQIDVFLAQGEYDSARMFIENNLEEESLRMFENELNYELVKILFIQSNYNDALQQAFNSLDKVEDKAQSVKFNFMIGCIYSAITDYSKSIEYLNLVTERSQDSALTVKAQLLLSGLYLDAGDTLSASNIIKDAYAITSISNINDKIKEHVAIQYSFYSGNYNQCKFKNKALIADTSSFMNTKSYAYAMIGDCLVKQDSLDEAGIYYEQFLQLTFETKDPEQIKVAASKLIKLYEKIGNQDKANAYHKIYNEAENDTLSFSAEKYRALYDIEKNRELQLVRNQNLRSYGLLAAGFLTILAIGVYLYFSKIKKAKSARLNKVSGKKIVISNEEIEKIKQAVNQLIDKQLFIRTNITRKSFCRDSDIKSERYLSHYINQEYKKSFSVFINDLRIEYAYHRIQSDDLFRQYKIEEIAKAAGFGSKKSFERAFLAKYEETPFKFISSLSS